jgi:hypothetical protein
MISACAIQIYNKFAANTFQKLRLSCGILGDAACQKLNNLLGERVEGKEFVT